MKTKIHKVIPMIIAITIMIPAVYASKEPNVIKQQEFKTEDKQKSTYASQVDFKNEINQSGKMYKLEDITYEITDTKYLNQIEKTVDSESVPTETVEADGITYNLDSTTQSTEKTSDSYTQKVTCYTNYDYLVSTNDIPKTKKTTAKNKRTGEETLVTCTYTGLTPNGQSIIENQMQIQFIGYGADSYEWNGYTIPSDSETPNIDGYEDALLESVGASGKITNVEWNGDPYVDDSGTIYRDAIATVEQTVPAYLANYTGSITVPEGERTIYHGTYKTDDVNGEATYTVLAKAVYSYEEPKKEKEEKTGLTDTQIKKIIAISVGSVLVLALLVAILFVLKKRNEKEQPYIIEDNADEEPIEGEVLQESEVTKNEYL